MKKNEMLIIGALILISLLGMGLFYLFNMTDSDLYVRISVNGEEIAKYPLNSEINEIFETENGFNTLSISGGHAEITEADCPDQICVRTYAISSPGETIVCLPHKLIVEIVSGE
ncbi:NusG domain II-containing protein [Eubacteriaceae bacterium ES3]|nr:NusG domain II-containing protein [Eubacteriaceae bacterium ES3]